jgi:hypothetical protein
MRHDPAYELCDICNADAMLLAHMVHGQWMNLCDRCYQDLNGEPGGYLDDGPIPGSISNEIAEHDRIEHHTKLQDTGVRSEDGLRITR